MQTVKMLEVRPLTFSQFETMLFSSAASFSFLAATSAIMPRNREKF